MADTKVSLVFEGFQEFDELVDEMVDQFGYKDSQKIMRSAVRQSMKSVLQMAKILAPIDTGALVSSLQIESRKPTAKDRRSKYVESNDFFLGLVTTKAFPQKLRKDFYESNKSLFESDKAAYRTAFKKVAKENLRFYDARAVAVEYGTAKMSSKPFMRPALESQSLNVINSLNDSFKVALEKKKAKPPKRKKVL